MFMEVYRFFGVIGMASNELRKDLETYGLSRTAWPTYWYLANAVLYHDFAYGEIPWYRGMERA